MHGCLSAREVGCDAAMQGNVAMSPRAFMIKNRHRKHAKSYVDISKIAPREKNVHSLLSFVRHASILRQEETIALNAMVRGGILLSAAGQVLPST